MLRAALLPHPATRRRGNVVTTSSVRHSDVAGRSQMKYPTTSQWNVTKRSQWYVSTTSYWNVVAASQGNLITTSHQYVSMTSQTSFK